MRLSPEGHPIHTRALAVQMTAGEGGALRADGYVIDLRKRGFVPVGSDLQGAGIIHHMVLGVVLDPLYGRIAKLDTAQPTVAFEASEATWGESCRDPVDRLAALAGLTPGEAGERLRDVFGGALGCSHLLALAQFLFATTEGTVASLESPRLFLPGQRMFRRDLVIDGSECAENEVDVVLQQSDLFYAPSPLATRPMERFARHDELRIQARLVGWPATIERISGAWRSRSREAFAEAPWRRDPAFDALAGVSLGKGGSAAIRRALAGLPAARDAMRMIGPALIQCRASFPDKWLNVATEAGHPGLTGIADSCYMWRRGGGLERVREGLDEGRK